MKISFELSLEDLVAYSMFYVKKTPAGRKAMLRSRLRLPLLFVLAVIMFAAICGALPPTFVLVEFVILSVLFFFLHPVINKRKVRRSYQNMEATDDIETGEETVIEFEEEHFSKTLPDSMRRMKYSAVRRVNVEREYIYITIRGRQIMILPRRAMADGGEALIGLMREKCGADKVV